MTDRLGPSEAMPRLVSSRRDVGLREPSGRRRLLAIDKAFLVFAFLVPLLPRPTIEGHAKWLAPASIGLLIVLVLLWQGGRRYAALGFNRHDVMLVVVVGLVCSMFAVRILLSGSWEELSYLASRTALLTGALLMLQWLRTRGIAPERVLESLFYGFILVSVVVIFVGITGVVIFETPRPARTLGIEFPFSKTSGVPRSYGEVGVLASASWAFLLVHFRRIPRLARPVVAVILLLSIVISQSRNVYLGIAIVTVTAFVTRWERSNTVAALMIPIALFSPVIVSSTLPTLRQIPLVNALVGADVYEANVYSREGLRHAAWRAVADEPTRALVGMDHETWFDYSYAAVGMAAVPHNHFVAMLLFLGLLGGGISLVALYVWPLVSLLRFPLSRFRSVRVVYLALIGATVSLNFYDGWFSPAVMIELALLWYVAFSTPARRRR